MSDLRACKRCVEKYGLEKMFLGGNSWYDGRCSACGLSGSTVKLQPTAAALVPSLSISDLERIKEEEAMARDNKLADVEWELFTVTRSGKYGGDRSQFRCEFYARTGGNLTVQTPAPLSFDRTYSWAELGVYSRWLDGQRVKMAKPDSGRVTVSKSGLRVWEGKEEAERT